MLVSQKKKAKIKEKQSILREYSKDSEKLIIE